MRIVNTIRHPRYIAAAVIVVYLYLYSLAFMNHPCTLGAAVCHQAPPCPLSPKPRARWVWARRANSLKIFSTRAGFEPTISLFITKTSLFKYTENFTTKKRKLSDKNSDIFRISAQNIDCGYSLEPPQRGGSNEYPQSMVSSRYKKNNVYPCKPQFYYIKLGFKGVKII